MTKCLATGYTWVLLQCRWCGGAMVGHHWQQPEPEEHDGASYHRQLIWRWFQTKYCVF